MSVRKNFHRVNHELLLLMQICRSLRRGRLAISQEIKASATTVTKPKNLPATDPRGNKAEASRIARTDSGRFSVRLPKTSTNVSLLNSNFIIEINFWIIARSDS